MPKKENDNDQQTSFDDARIYDGEHVPPNGQESTAIIPRGGIQTRTQYHTAIQVQRPRDLDAVVRAVEREAQFAGTDFYYRWPVKDKQTGKTKIVKGGSIGLAMAMAREWTNCAIPVDMREEGGKWLFTASFVDLERGFTVTRTFRQAIPLEAPGKYDADRWQDMKFQVGQSKAIRNVIFAGTPRWLREKAVRIAEEAEANKIGGKEGIDKAVKKALAEFEKLGISKERVIAIFDKPLNDFDMDDILTLRSFYKQLTENEATAEQLFPPIEKEKAEKKESK